MVDVVILVGGLGERLRPFTEILPKPLLPLGNKSIVEVIISKLKNQGFGKFILATNYKSDLIKSVLGSGEKMGVEIAYSVEKKRLGTAGPLKLIEDQVSDTFIVTNGDILTNLDFIEMLEMHKSKNADITVLTKSISLPLQYGVIDSDDDNNILSFKERPNVTSNVCAGIYILNKSLLKLVPKDEFFDMPQLIKLALEKKHKAVAYHCTDYWMDLGRIDDYNKAKEDVTSGKVNDA